jgi:hypothetical protein
VRLPLEAHERLASEADTLGVKQGTLLRRIIFEHLRETSPRSEEIVERLDRLELASELLSVQLLELLTTLRHFLQAFAVGTEAVLLNVSPQEAHREIKAWCARTLGPLHSDDSPRASSRGTGQLDDAKPLPANGDPRSPTAAFEEDES